MPKIIHTKQLLTTLTTSIILGAIFNISFVSATDVDLNVTIPELLKVTISSPTISLNLNPATSQFDTEDLTVSVATNNQAGYTMSMRSIGGDTNLTRTSSINNTTPTIPTLTEARTEDDFDANHWGYRFDTGSFLPFDGEIEDYSHAYGPASDTDTTRTITFAAKVDKNQTFGTYELGLIFTATARPTTHDFTINYDSGVSTIAVKQDLNSCDPSLTTGETNACPLAGTITNSTTTSGSGSVSGLGNGITYYLVPTFTEGMEYKSWTNDQNSVGTLGTPDTTTGQVTYTIGDPITDTATNSVTLTSKKSGYCTSEATCMQTYTASMCASGASSSAVTLTDDRDGQTYTVRYINNKCWMTKNIAIGCSSPEGGNEYGGTIKSIKLTSSDSNVSSDWTTTTASLTLGDDASNPRMECNTTYGGYYNYTAATAGTITSGSTEASYSICPKGWRLPTQSEFSGITGSSSAFSPVYSGDYYGGTLNYAGPSGYGGWWSSTAYNSTRRYYLRYSNGSLNVSYSLNRYDGGSVRCVRSS